MRILHIYTEDDSCISLLKILLTSHCIFDRVYCITPKSNDIKRATFEAQGFLICFLYVFEHKLRYIQHKDRLQNSIFGDTLEITTYKAHSERVWK